MAKVKFEDTRFAKFIKKRGMYLSLALMMFAAGISAYAVYGSNRLEQKVGDKTDEIIASIGEGTQQSPDTPPSPSKPETTPQKTEQTTPVEKTESEVEDNSVASFFVLPVTNGEILKEYDAKSLQYSNTYKDWRLHTAIDFAADAKTPVKSAGHGVVADVYYDTAYGQTVVIDHGNGIVAYYSGLNSSPSVKKGDRVTAGFQIGVIDQIPSEAVDAPHLHLRVEVDGVLKNPLEIMKFTGE